MNPDRVLAVLSAIGLKHIFFFFFFGGGGGGGGVCLFFFKLKPKLKEKNKLWTKNSWVIYWLHYSAVHLTLSKTWHLLWLFVRGPIQNACNGGKESARVLSEPYICVNCVFIWEWGTYNILIYITKDIFSIFGIKSIKKKLWYSVMKM